jgi:HAD superfamily phosphoserine phosphatase-like hydrolase
MKKRIVHSFKKDEWKPQLSIRFTNVSYCIFKTYKIKIQIAIITANNIEMNAVISRLKNLKDYNCKFSVVYQKQTYYIARFGVFNAVVIRLGSMGIHAPNAASFSANDLIKVWNPHAIIAVGVAMGMKPSEQQLGDVLISKEILNYNILKSTERCDINRSPRPMADSSLYDRFTNCSEWSFCLDEKRKAMSHEGLFITGASLVNNKRLTNKLKKLFPDAIGNEMEASGIWAASERNRVPWIIVKGVCDWGKDKTEDFQPLAATSAVSLCETVFSKEDALSGIVNLPKRKSLVIKKINSLKLFYCRKLKGLSEQDLGKICKISELDIIRYESFDISKGVFDNECFPNCPLSDIQKLEAALSIRKENGLEIKDTRNNYMGYLLTFYYKNKLNLLYNNIKAVVFDFDGTLTKSHERLSTWQKIWVELGYSVDDCNRYHREYDEKRITHKQWCQITCQHFQRKHLTQRNISEISSRISLIEGCSPTLRKLKNNNIHLYIVSGSIREIIMEVLGPDLSQLFERIYANRMEFHHKNGELKNIIGTEYDFEGKCNCIVEIAKEINIQPYEILFVGNSDNDEMAPKSGAITLCVNPRSTNGHNIEIWNYWIDNMRNLSEILPYVISKKNNNTG